MKPVLIFLAVASILPAVEHRGTVKSAGLPIPGVSVTATLEDRKVSTMTDEAGRFALDELASGPWVVEVEIFGFEKQRRDAFIGEQAANLDFDLKMAHAAVARPAEAPKRAPGNGSNGFQQLAVTQTAQNEVLAALNTPAPDSPQMAAISENANESFLVTGSLSRGLQAPQDEGFGGMRPGEFAFGMPGGPGGQGGAPGDGAQGAAPSMMGRMGGPGGGGPGGGFGGGMRGGPGGGPGGGRGMGGGPGGGGPGGRGGMDQRRGGPGGQRPDWMGRAGTTSFGNRAGRGREGIRGGVSLSLRNSALDARPFSLTGQTLPKPSYDQARFSVMAGGQLRIPKLFTDEKTFFFVTYSGGRSRNPYNSTSTLPSALERQGDFSQSVMRGSVSIFDPLTRLPFPGNVIPQSRINPASLALLSYFPLPNQPGTIQNYQYLTSTAQNSDNLGVRLNRSITRKDRLAGSYNVQWRNGESAQLFGFRDPSTGRGQSADLSWTHNVRRGLINTVRWTFSRNTSDTLPFFANGPNVAANLGIQGTSTNPDSYGPPNLSFTNFGGLTDGSAVLRTDQSTSVGESLLYSRGKHNLRFGGEYRRTLSNSFSDQNGRGTYAFSGLMSSALDANGQPVAATGFDFADFLLGFPQSGSVRYGGADIYFRGASYNWFAQDDFRVLPNFSVNLGLRYEFLVPLHEKYNRMANLDIAPGFTGVAVVTPGATGPYTGTFPTGLVDPDRNNLAPRIGIAWKPIPKRPLQVRAGWGVYFNGSVYSQAANRLAQQPPFAKTASLVTSLAYPLTIQNGFVNVTPTQITNTFAIDRSYRAGYAQTWNLSVQQDLPASFVAEIGYLGTKGTRLDVQRLPNRAAPGSPLTSEQRRQIGNATGFTFDSSEGNSIYHAAQLRLTRRFRRGMSANALYTFGKSIDNVSSFGGGGTVVAQNDKDLRAERGLSSFDQRHTLNLSYMLMSPVSESSRGVQIHGFTGRLLSGWSLSGGMTFRSGSPFTANVLGNLSNSGGTGAVGSGRADATGLPVSDGIGFFNPLAFTTPLAGLFGNAARNTIPGPSQLSMNASFGRGFRIDERRRLDLRMESNNFLNRVSFTRMGTTVNASNFDLATAAAGMRTVTLNLRLRF
jgi:hypothetical protein